MTEGRAHPQRQRDAPAAQPLGRRDDRDETPGEVATDRLLTASDVAAMLTVPERWVREHTRSGVLPHVCLGRYRRYRRAAILDWVAEQEQGGATWRRHRPVPQGGTK
jgi:excisionase family DNA binding protein